MVVEGIQINAATVAAFVAIYGPLSLVIITLFKLLLGRMERAEKQVDTLIPLNASVIEHIRELKDTIRSLREDLVRERGQRP